MEGKICSKCKLLKDFKVFSKTKKKPCGGGWYYNSWCNLCRAESNRLKSGAKKKCFTVVTADTKVCGLCKECLPHKYFSKSSRGSGGLSSYCKACHANRYRCPEKSRKATKRYRESNREVYLANHRISQFKRRQNLSVVDDGTLTKEVLAQIYNKDTCYWCKRYTFRGDRTLEHIVELISGGVHGISNCTMACHSCNSARLNRGVTK